MYIKLNEWSTLSSPNTLFHKCCTILENLIWVVEFWICLFLLTCRLATRNFSRSRTPIGMFFMTIPKGHLWAFVAKLAVLIPGWDHCGSPLHLLSPFFPPSFPHLLFLPSSMFMRLLSSEPPLKMSVVLVDGWLAFRIKTVNFFFQAGVGDIELKAVSLKNILQGEFKPDTSYISWAFKHLAQVYNVRKFDYPAIHESVSIVCCEICECQVLLKLKFC